MLTHGAAAFNLDGYTGYAGAIMQWYQQTQGAGSAMDRLQEIYNVYHQNDASFTMADALEEFTAEATAGLFSSEEGANDFLNWLQNESGYTATQKKTVLQKAAELLQKIFDKIRALLKDGSLSDVAADFAAAQADEAAQLRQMFLQVLDGMEVAEGSKGGERYAIKQTENGVTYIEIDKDAIDVSDEKNIPINITNYLKKHFDNLIRVNGQSIRVNQTTNHEWRHAKEGEFLYNFSRKKYKDKVRTLANADEMLKAATDWEGEKKIDESNNGFKEFARSGVIVVKIGNRWYRGQLLVGTNESDDSAGLYDFVNFFKMKAAEIQMAKKKDILSLRGDRISAAEVILPQSSEEVNTFEEKNSLPMAEQMDKLRLSLGLEAQNSRLTQKIEDYQQIVRQQDAEIRELQRELSRAGVRIFADGAKVAKTAGRLLQGYGAEGIRGTERRQINDALAGLYNQMANEQLTKDALETEAGEIAEKILKQSKYMTPAVSDYSRAVMDDIKSVGIVLSDAQKEEMAYRYGSYGAFYRQTFGKLRIRNDGMPLDQRWQELSERDATIEKPPFRAAFLISSGRSPSPGRTALRRARGTAL